MKLIDAHTHLQFPEFKDDLDAVMTRAKEAGVQYLINGGTNNDTSWQAIELAKKYDIAYATIGIHPHEADGTSLQKIPEFDDWLKEPKVVAIGEIGLDYHDNRVPQLFQRQTFASFLKIADNSKKPIVLHIRDAYDDVIKMLKDFFKPPIRGMSHCFSGTVDQMSQLIQLGLHISFTAVVTYKKNDALREAVKCCPANRILIETDAPYLPPQSKRGQRNEPSYLEEPALCIAQIKNVSPEIMGDQFVNNFCTLFGISH